jgi:hypothetical protein
MPGLRSFIQSDIAGVADLIWKVLHEQTGPAPNSLHLHLQELFLANPWLDDGIVSRVYEDAQGNVRGFFGAVPRVMSLQGKTIRLAFGSNFVMDPENRGSMASLQLVRTFLKGSQDVSITDSANEMSRQLLRSLGFTAVPIYSLQWARPLRPSAYAIDIFCRMKKSSTIKFWGRVASPLFRITDSLAAKLSVSPFRQTSFDAQDEDLDNETLLHCLTTIPSKHWITPQYNQGSLNWVLTFIDNRRVFGSLRKALVRNKNGKIIGWYIYSLPERGVGEVFQIGAESASVGTVLDHLFFDAWQHGLLGLQGRMEPQFMEELTTRSCFFFRHGSWTMIHSNKPELLTAFHSGNLFFSRLDGEWCLRHGGRRDVAL